MRFTSFSTLPERKSVALEIEIDIEEIVPIRGENTTGLVAEAGTATGHGSVHQFAATFPRCGLAVFQ